MCYLGWYIILLWHSGKLSDFIFFNGKSPTPFSIRFLMKHGHKTSSDWPLGFANSKFKYNSFHSQTEGFVFDKFSNFSINLLNNFLPFNVFLSTTDFPSFSKKRRFILVHSFLNNTLPLEFLLFF